MTNEHEEDGNSEEGMLEGEGAGGVSETRIVEDLADGAITDITQLQSRNVQLRARAKTLEQEVELLRSKVDGDDVEWVMNYQRMERLVRESEEVKPFLDTIKENVGPVRGEHAQTTREKHERYTLAVKGITRPAKAHITKEGVELMENIATVIERSVGGGNGDGAAKAADYFALVAQYSEVLKKYESLVNESDKAMERLQEASGRMDDAEEAWREKEGQYESDIAERDATLAQAKEAYDGMKDELDAAKGRASEAEGRYGGAKETIERLQREATDLTGANKDLRSEMQHKRQLAEGEIQHLRQMLENYRASISLGDLAEEDRGLLDAADEVKAKADDLYENLSEGPE